MSLDQPESIPVDRHVYAFAEKKYRIRSKKYDDIADQLRSLWGEYAGWAHSILFTADLRAFRNYEVDIAVKEEAGSFIKQELHHEGTTGDATAQDIVQEPAAYVEAVTEATSEIMETKVKVEGNDLLDDKITTGEAGRPLRGSVARHYTAIKPLPRRAKLEKQS